MTSMGYFLRSSGLRQVNSQPAALAIGYLLIKLCAILLCCSGACFAQAQQAAQDDTQTWQEVQISVPLKKKIDMVVNGQLRLGRNLTDFVDERGGMGLVFTLNN